MFKDGDKVKLKNGGIVTIKGFTRTTDGTEAYYTDKNFIVTPDMIDSKIN